MLYSLYMYNVDYAISRVCTSLYTHISYTVTARRPTPTPTPTPHTHVIVTCYHLTIKLNMKVTFSINTLDKINT